MSLDKVFSRVVDEKEASILRPAASQLGTAAREHGYVVVRSFPGLDSGLAAAIALNVLRSFNVEAILYFEPLPPQELLEPTLLLGYPPVAAQELKARSPSALIGVGERPQGITPVAVSAAPHGTVAGLAAGVFSEITIVGSISLLAVSAALWRGLDTGKRGEITGIEAGIAEIMKLENKLEEIFNLRLARWLTRPTEKALAMTVLPHLPGITGEPEEARRLLEADPRLEKLLGRVLEEAPEDAAAVLGEKLYKLLKETSRVPRKPTEVIGVNYYSRSSSLPDLREAAAVYACCSGRLGLDAVAALGVAEKPASAACFHEYLAVFESHARYVNQNAAAKPRTIKTGGVTIAVLPEAPCPLLAEAELRKLGVIPPEAVAGFETPEGVIVPLESLLAKAGYAGFREMITGSCIEPVEGRPYGLLRQTRCS